MINDFGGLIYNVSHFNFYLAPAECFTATKVDICKSDTTIHECATPHKPHICFLFLLITKKNKHFEYLDLVGAFK